MEHHNHDAKLLLAIIDGQANLSRHLHERMDQVIHAVAELRKEVKKMSDTTQAALDTLQADVAALATQISAFLAGLPKGGLTQAQQDEMAAIDSAVKAISASVPPPAA